MKNILLLVNPVSGKGKNLELAIEISEKLKQIGWQSQQVNSDKIAYFTNYLATNDLQKYQAIGVVGGDGSFHEVANALIPLQNVPPLLIFPCGSGNSFTMDLDFKNIDFAVAALKRFEVKEIDFCEINTSTATSYSVNVIGWGLVSGINKTAEKLRWIGNSRYNIASLIHIFKNPKFGAKIKINEEIFEGNFSFFLACNTMHTGKGMKIAPLAELNDGLFDILLVPHLSVWQLLNFFPKVFSGKHIHSPLIKYMYASSFSIESEISDLVLDGEVKLQTPFVANVIRQKLSVIV